MLFLIGSVAVGLVGTRTSADSLSADEVRQYRRALASVGAQQAQVYAVQGRHFALLSGHRLLVVTDEYARHKGYKGVSTLGIVLTRRLRVSRIVFIDSPDTPTYIKVVRMRIRVLLGQKLRQSRRPVLAITGATATCDAVTRTVSETLDALASLLGKAEIQDNAVLYDGKALKPVTTVMSVTN